MPITWFANIFSHKSQAKKFQAKNIVWQISTCYNPLQWWPHCQEPRVLSPPPSMRNEKFFWQPIIMIPYNHHSLPPLLHGNSDGRRWDQHQSHHPGFKKSSLLLQSCYNLLFPYTYNSWTLCPYISHAEGYLKIVRKRFGKLWIELQHLRRRSLWRCQNINHHHHGP